MSHQAQLDFVAGLRHKFPEYFIRKSVLEIGSLNINGSIRPFFEQCTYVGVDLGEGADVDVVAAWESVLHACKAKFLALPTKVAPDNVP